MSNAHAQPRKEYADVRFHWQVSYREAITGSAEIDYTHKKQSGGSGQFARVKINFEPLEEGATGFEFKSDIKGGSIPKEYIPGVQKVRISSSTCC